MFDSQNGILRILLLWAESHGSKKTIDEALRPRKSYRGANPSSFGRVLLLFM